MPLRILRPAAHPKRHRPRPHLDDLADADVRNERLAVLVHGLEPQRVGLMEPPVPRAATGLGRDDGVGRRET